MMENKPTDTLKMLDWETKKGQRNLGEKEKIVTARLIKETVPRALGEDISFEKLFSLYILNNENLSLESSDLIEEILETLKMQLGGEAEVDESNLIFILVLIYESFDSKNTKVFSPPPDTEIKKITI